MKLNGSQIVLEVLKEQGVDTIFGYPGGTILNIFDELYKYGDTFKHILTAHEQGASHAADGYARATGKVGVCFATSGPGATNLVTGIATAYMDSVPVVAITCNYATSGLGRDSFQEVDICGITMPITKHNFQVENVEKLADTIRRAFFIAQSGRKGPVLIDIPKDITSAECEYTPMPKVKPEKAKAPKDSAVKRAVLKSHLYMSAAALSFLMLAKIWLLSLKRLTHRLLQVLWALVLFRTIIRFISALSVCTAIMNVIRLHMIVMCLLPAVLVFQTVLQETERNLHQMQKFYILILTQPKWIKTLFQIIIFAVTLPMYFLFLQGRLSSLTTASGEKRLKLSAVLLNSFKSVIM